MGLASGVAERAIGWYSQIELAFDATKPLLSPARLVSKIVGRREAPLDLGLPKRSREWTPRTATMTIRSVDKVYSVDHLIIERSRRQVAHASSYSRRTCTIVSKLCPWNFSPRGRFSSSSPVLHKQWSKIDNKWVCTHGDADYRFR